MAHRLAWLYMTGVWPTKDIDHQDRNRQNNKWKNLREATFSQNKANASKNYNKSGYKGAYSQHGKTFFSSIGVNGKRIYLGTFPTAKLAHQAYVKAAKHYFGEFARAR
jgi:hypothetical protein